MAAKIFRINYKSDFILTLESDAGWITPFCIKFWTGAPSQAFFAQWDGTTYTHCAYDPSEPTKLTVQFDDHHLPIGDLKFQIAYHFTVADFPNDTEDEVLNQANITTEIDGEEYQVMLDFNGETAPEIQFALPAYANEAQRIANEQQRIAAEETRIDNEAQRIQNEETRINQEQTRQDNEAQRIRNEQTRINQEEARVREFATLKHDAQEATTAANDAAALANQKAQLAADKAQLAADKAALAQDAAALANEKAQLAAAKASLANDAAALANQKAQLAQQKAEYAQVQGGYAKDQGDYAKEQGDYAKRKGDDAAAQMQQQAQAFSEAQAARQTAYEQAEGTESGSEAGDGSRWGAFKTNEAARDAKVDAKVADITNLQKAVAEGAVYDISANHLTEGVPTKYANLSAALGADGANIPADLRKGGMSVKFVLSSDNKYVQFRYKLPNVSGYGNPFLNVANWQGIEDTPTTDSENFVTSGGIAEKLQIITFNGKGGGTQLFGPKVKVKVGNTYRICINKPDIDFDAEVNWVIFQINGYDSSNVATTLLQKRLETLATTLDDYYNIQIPNNIEYIIIVTICAVGTVQTMWVEDITSILDSTDNVPISGSQNLVKSGGVYSSLVGKVEYETTNIITDTDTIVLEKTVGYTDGGIDNNSNFRTYILPVKEGEIIRCKIAKFNSFGTAAIAFYTGDTVIFDSSTLNGAIKKCYIKSYSVAATNGTNWYEAIAPEGAAYVAVCNYNTNLATPEAYIYTNPIGVVDENIEVGSKHLVYGNAVSDALISNRSYYSSARNILPTEFANGSYYVDDTPALAGSNVSFTSEGTDRKAQKFRVIPGNKYTISNIQQRGIKYDLLFVTNEMKLISAHLLSPNPDVLALEPQTFIAPDNAYYMLINSYSQDPYCTEIFYYTCASNDSVENLRVENIYNEKGLELDSSDRSGYFYVDSTTPLGTDYSITANVTWSHIKLSVNVGEHYKIKYRTGGTLYYVCYLDTNNKLVGSDLFDTKSNTNETGYVVIPDGVKYMVINTRINILTSDTCVLLNDTSRIKEVMKPTASTRYLDKAPLLNAACRFRTKSNKSRDWQTLLITDQHADVVAQNNARLISESFDTLDCVICLGDINNAQFNEPDTISEWQSVLNKAEKPWFGVIGNHDTGNSKYVGICASNESQLYDAFIKPIVDKGWLKEGEYTENKCYYYHDFIADNNNHFDNIRLIVVNEYDEDIQVDDSENAGWEPITYDASYGEIQWQHSYVAGDCINCGSCVNWSFRAKTNLTTPSNHNVGDITNIPMFKMLRGNRAIRKPQMEWFIQTLNSTPTGYKVIIAMHNAFSQNAINQNTLPFAQSDLVGSPGAGLQSCMHNNDIFNDIINAFINRTAYSDKIIFDGDAEYMNTLNDGTTDYAYVLSGDFTNAKADFMCYLGGHGHRDLIWKTSTVNPQYQISPILAHTVAWQPFSFADIRTSIEDGYAKDSLTVITFRTKTNDYQNDERKIVLNKIGVDITWDMEDRKHEIINLDE